jgi:hypothetical protein
VSGLIEVDVEFSERRFALSNLAGDGGLAVD